MTCFLCGPLRPGSRAIARGEKRLRRDLIRAAADVLGLHGVMADAPGWGTDYRHTIPSLPF